MIRFDGGAPTVREGLRIAGSKFWIILGYAIIAATVGMVLRAIQERVGFVGRIIVGLLGMGWTVATYLVVPILVSRDVGPIDAVKESAGVLKKTWGENVVGQVGMGAVFLLIQFVIIALGIALAMAAATAGSVAAFSLAVGVAVVGVVMAALVQAALGGIYSVALYRFATEGAASSGFDPNALQTAFAPKRS